MHLCDFYTWENTGRIGGMMKIFKIVLLALVTITVSTNVTFAKSGTLSQKQLKRYKPLTINEGKPLKLLKTAKLGDVNLAKPIKYFDIRYYHSDTKEYWRGYSFDMNAWENLSVKEKKKIQTQRPVNQGISFGVKSILKDGGPMLIANVHYIDNNSIANTFSSRKKLIEFLGTIDTPVELSMLLLSERGRIRYKEMDDLYIIRTDFIYEENDGRDGGCYHENKHIIMNKKGNVLMERNNDRPYAEKKCKVLRKKLKE